VQETTENEPFLYRLNGDYNPLHADPSIGKAIGFGGTIMHGLYSWNVGCHAVVKEFCGSDATKLRSFEARFASPVIPGGTLVVDMWKTGVKEDGWEEVVFTVTVKGGKVVLSNGRALVKAGESRSKL